MDTGPPAKEAGGAAVVVPDAAAVVVEETPPPVVREPGRPAPAPLASTAAERQAPRRDRVLILQSSVSDNYSASAAALEARLGTQYEVESIVLDGNVRDAEVLVASDDAFSLTIAIGSEAAELASVLQETPLIVCQVIDPHVVLERRDNVFAVSASPPLELQLTAWRAFARDATTIGLILPPDDDVLLAAAQQAAVSAGLTLETAYAATDREFLYRFKRLASRIDGLWILPTASILSPAALREAFDFARERGLHTLVFDPSLLDWGALISVGSNVDDVADTVAGLAAKIGAGEAAALPRVTALSAVEPRINPETARAIDPAFFGAGGRRTAAAHANAR